MGLVFSLQWFKDEVMHGFFTRPIAGAIVGAPSPSITRKSLLITSKLLSLYIGFHSDIWSFILSIIYGNVLTTVGIGINGPMIGVHWLKGKLIFQPSRSFADDNNLVMYKEYNNCWEFFTTSFGLGTRATGGQRGAF